MNRNAYAAASVLFAGCAAASLFLVTFNTGWLLRDLQDELYAVLLSCALLVPVAFIIAANFSERVRRALLLVALLLFETCSYVVVTTMQNAGINASYIFYSPSIAWYSLMIGAGLSATTLSMAELGRVSRIVSTWPLLAFAALSIPGTALAAILAVGISGWIQNVLLAMILMPAGVLVLLVASPNGEDAGVPTLLDPAALRAAHVVHPLKGGYLTLFFLLCGVNLALLVGINGMGLAPSFFGIDNSIFYSSTVAGVAVATGIAALAGRRVPVGSMTDKKNRDARFFLILALGVHSISWFISVLLEITVSGHHGSGLAQIIDGLAAGIIIGFMFTVALLHHPPRSFMTYMMLPIFCFGAFLVAGQMLKAMSLGSAGIESLTEYLPWVIYPELAVIGLIVLLAAIPRHRNNNRPTGGT